MKSIRIKIKYDPIFNKWDATIYYDVGAPYSTIDALQRYCRHYKSRGMVWIMENGISVYVRGSDKLVKLLDKGDQDD